MCSLVGPWTDGLLNASDPLPLAFDVAAQHCAPCASEDGTVDDASRRPGLGLACPGACRVAAAVLPYMAAGSAARRVTLATLWLALHAATANVAAASSAGCLPHTLTALGHAAQCSDGDASETTALHACVVALASWSCRLSEARAWLASCGRSPPGGPVRAVLLSALAQALSPGSPHGCAPADVFLLDGETSGLVCPPQAQWPFTDGLSVLTWLRIESVSDSASASDTAVAAAAAATAAASSRCAPHLTPQAAAATAAAAAGEGESFMPRLCSFLSAQGHGLEAYLHGPFVVIEAGPSPAGGGPPGGPASGASPLHSRGAHTHGQQQAHLGRVTFTRPLPQRVWMCLCLECGAGVASLYVDGMLWDSHPLVLPRMQGQPLAFCCVGTNPPAAMVGLQRRRRQCALFCSLGPLYVFDQALGAKTIAALAARGPDHLPVLGYAANPGSSHRCGGYVPTAAPSGPDSHPSSAMTTLAAAAALDATLAPATVCVYHPRMRLCGRTAPDVGPGCAVATGGGVASGHGHVIAGGGQPRGAGAPPSAATPAPRGALALTGVATAHRHTLRDALWALSEGGQQRCSLSCPPAWTRRRSSSRRRGCRAMQAARRGRRCSLLRMPSGAWRLQLTATPEIWCPSPTPARRLPWRMRCPPCGPPVPAATGTRRRSSGCALLTRPWQRRSLPCLSAPKGTRRWPRPCAPACCWTCSPGRGRLARRWGACSAPWLPWRMPTQLWSAPSAACAACSAAWHAT